MLILRVLAEDQILREAKFSSDPLKAIQRLKSPMPRTSTNYTCPLPAEGFAIDLVPFNEEGLPLEECILTDQLWLFWKHSRFQVADAEEQGSSWLELFARYQYLGGKLVPDDPSTTVACSFKKSWAFSRCDPEACSDSKGLRQYAITSSQPASPEQSSLTMGSSHMSRA